MAQLLTNQIPLRSIPTNSIPPPEPVLKNADLYSFDFTGTLNTYHCLNSASPEFDLSNLPYKAKINTG